MSTWFVIDLCFVGCPFHHLTTPALSWCTEKRPYLRPIQVNTFGSNSLVYLVPEGANCLRSVLLNANDLYEPPATHAAALPFFIGMPYRLLHLLSSSALRLASTYPSSLSVVLRCRINSLLAVLFGYCHACHAALI